MTTGTSEERADRVAARATGIGIGLIAFITTWTVGARITEHLWGPPADAYVAMAGAILTGIAVALRAGRRLDTNTSRRAHTVNDSARPLSRR